MNGDGFKDFLARYGGAIIGLIVAIILIALQIYKVIIWTVVIVFCMIAGNYIQHNRELVKEKIKMFIDKMP